MLPLGPATKVTIYLNRDTGSSNGFLHDEILQYLQENGVHGATILRPYAGFGVHGRLHKQDAADVAGLHLPVLICFIETAQKVETILRPLLNMMTDGLVEAHPTEILKNISTGERVIS
jgi:PII-like signaling protein